MQRRVKVGWDGESWRVDLPEYRMIPDSFLPVIRDVTTPNGVLPDVDPATPALLGLTCLVEIPNRIMNPKTGRVDRAKMAHLYRNHKKWGNRNYRPKI